jgi:hypothetical protein
MFSLSSCKSTLPKIFDSSLPQACSPSTHFSEGQYPHIDTATFGDEHVAKGVSNLGYGTICDGDNTRVKRPLWGAFWSFTNSQHTGLILPQPQIGSATHEICAQDEKHPISISRVLVHDPWQAM